MSSDNLTTRTISGIGWLYLQTAVSAVLQLVMAGVMARLLDPAAFGLIALGNLALRFVNYFARGGMTKALIHQPSLGPYDIRAGFGASVGLGALFTAIVMAAAPLAGPLFGDPRVVPIIRWMSLSMLLIGLGSTASSLLQREMRFRALAVREIISYLIGYVGVGLVLAARGAGVWALVAAMLSQVALSSLLAVLARPHPVRPVTHLTPYRKLFSFGSRVSLIGFLEFLGANTDTFAVGRLAGPSVLGLYNRANLLADIPTQYLGTSLSKVLFPAFSSLQHDTPRLRSAYLSAVRVVAGVVLPAAVGMMVASPEIVAAVLGDDWLGAIPILPWLAASAGVSMVNHFGAVVAEAQAALNAKLAIAASKVVVLVGLLWVAAGRAPWWYAAALFGASLYVHVLYIALLRRTLSTTYRQLLSVYVGPLLAAMLTAGTIAIVRTAMVDAGAPPALTLVLEVVTGAASLLVLGVVGPLRSTRRDIVTRLTMAGVTHRSPPPLGLLFRLLGAPRGVPEPTVGRATARTEPSDLPREAPTEDLRGDDG